MGKLIHIKNAFAVCSVLLLIVFSIPRIGDAGHLWMNGLYESFVIILVFPLIVSMGAGGNLTGKYPVKICKFLGDISYPIYITHYSLIYVYTAWVADNKVPMAKGLWAGLLLFIASVAIAWACLKLYDEPLRDWLKKRYLMKRV